MRRTATAPSCRSGVSTRRILRRKPAGRWSAPSALGFTPRSAHGENRFAFPLCRRLSGALFSLPCRPYGGVLTQANHSPSRVATRRLEPSACDRRQRKHRWQVVDVDQRNPGSEEWPVHDVKRQSTHIVTFASRSFLPPPATRSPPAIRPHDIF